MIKTEVSNIGIVVVTCGSNAGIVRIPITPCDSVDEALLQLHESLCAFGLDTLTSDDLVVVKSACCSAWTPDVVSAYRTRAAPSLKTYTQKEYEDAIKGRLDREAQAAPYLWDSIDRVAAFAESTAAKYRAEARYFIALRDVCWILCFEALANPPEIPPTPSEFAEAIVAQALVNVGLPIYA